VNKISNPFPATGIVSPPGRDFPPGRSVQTATAGTAVCANNYFDHPAGYVQQWNLDLQRELPAGFFVDVAYAGAHGVHLPQFDTNINQIPDSLITAAAAQAAQGLTPTIAQPVAMTDYPFSPALARSLAPGNL